MRALRAQREARCKMSNLLFKLFIKNHNDTENPEVRERYGVFCGIVGIICNLLLCGFKIVTGWLLSSISIMADGLNNLTDMGSSVISIVGFRLAGKPADEDHPFGHGRIEFMSAFIVAVIIVLVGFELFSSSVSALISNAPAPEYNTATLIILAGSVLIKLWLFLFNRLAGKKITSGVLLATAQDCLNDVIATAVILLSVILSMVFALPFNLDAVMGILVSIFILYSGISSAKQTMDEILGKPAPRELIDELEKTIMSFEGFLGIHDLIVHNYGPGRQFASVHVEVPYGTDIVHCHEQIDLCEKIVLERMDLSLVIHMDPIDINNEYVTNTRAAIESAIREIDGRLTLHDFRMTPKSEKRTNLIFDVVVPSDIKNRDALNDDICAAAKKIDKTFCCVITFDNNYV